MKNDDMMSMTWGCKPIYTIFFSFFNIVGHVPCVNSFLRSAGLGLFQFHILHSAFTFCELSYTTWPPKQITTNHVCFVGWRTATSQVSPGIYGYRFDEDSVVLNKLICFIRLSTFFRHLLVTLSPRGIIVKKYIVNHGAIACRICFIGYKPDLHIRIQNSKFKIQHSN